MSNKDCVPLAGHWYSSTRPAPIRRLLTLTGLDQHLDIRVTPRPTRALNPPRRPLVTPTRALRCRSCPATAARRHRPDAEIGKVMELAKRDLLRLLRRIGRFDLVEEVDRVLPARIDTIRDAQLLARYGLTRNQLTDRLGGSP